MSTVAWTAYDETSHQYFEAYESLRFVAAHRSFLRFLPPKGAACLDIGAGSGRDAAALAKRGYVITAVEPSSGLRRLAMAQHRNNAIKWIDDSLPDLTKVKKLRTRYEFVLLSAVWMHIAPNERLQSLRSMRELLSPTGCIAMTLRIGKAAPDRVMYPTNVNDLLEQAKLLGLVPAYVGRTTRDSLKRTDISWIKLVLRFDSGATARVPALV